MCWTWVCSTTPGHGQPGFSAVGLLSTGCGPHSFAYTLKPSRTGASPCAPSSRLSVVADAVKVHQVASGGEPNWLNFEVLTVYRIVSSGSCLESSQWSHAPLLEDLEGLEARPVAGKFLLL